MPAGVHLLIGLPAYPPNPPTHDSGETVPAAITGVAAAATRRAASADLMTGRLSKL